MSRPWDSKVLVPKDPHLSSPVEVKLEVADKLFLFPHDVEGNVLEYFSQIIHIENDTHNKLFKDNVFGFS